MADSGQPPPPEPTPEERAKLQQPAEKRAAEKFGWKPGDVEVRQPPPKPLKPAKGE